MHPNVRLVDHPLVRRDLTLLRDRDTDRVVFRAAMRRVARVLAYRAFEDVRCREVAIETPLEAARGVVLVEQVALVPILRAGLGLVDGFLDVLPEAKVCHVGMVRNEESHRPEVYLSKLERLDQGDRVFVIDPMLATGGSAVATLDRLAELGFSSATLVCVLATPEGIERVQGRHPATMVLTAAVDRGLDQQAFIRPGLGDAGDRLFDA